MSYQIDYDESNEEYTLNGEPFEELIDILLFISRKENIEVQKTACSESHAISILTEAGIQIKILFDY